MRVNLREPPKARLHFVKPMLPRAVAELPSGANWLYEFKLDGYRVLIVKQGRVVTVFSRRGKNLNSGFPTIAAAFSFCRATRYSMANWLYWTMRKTLICSFTEA